MSVREQLISAFFSHELKLQPQISDRSYTFLLLLLLFFFNTRISFFSLAMATVLPGFNGLGRSMNPTCAFQKHILFTISSDGHCYSFAWS